MYKAVTLAGGIREPLLTCSSFLKNERKKKKKKNVILMMSALFNDRDIEFNKKKIAVRNNNIFLVWKQNSDFFLLHQCFS